RFALDEACKITSQKNPDNSHTHERSQETPVDFQVSDDTEKKSDQGIHADDDQRSCSCSFDREFCNEHERGNDQETSACAYQPHENPGEKPFADNQGMKLRPAHRFI